MNMELKAARERKKLTQSQVAKKTDISETHYQNIEYDKNEPGVRTAIRIADALGVEVSEAFRALWEQE